MAPQPARAVLPAGHRQVNVDVWVGLEGWGGRGLEGKREGLGYDGEPMGWCSAAIPPSSSSSSFPPYRAGLALMQADGKVFSCHRDRWDAIWCAGLAGITWASSAWCAA